MTVLSTFQVLYQLVFLALTLGVHTCNATFSIQNYSIEFCTSTILLSNHQYNSELDYNLGTALKITFRISGGLLSCYHYGNLAIAELIPSYRQSPIKIIPFHQDISVIEVQSLLSPLCDSSIIKMQRTEGVRSPEAFKGQTVRHQFFHWWRARGADSHMVVVVVVVVGEHA